MSSLDDAKKLWRTMALKRKQEETAMEEGAREAKRLSPLPGHSGQGSSNASIASLSRDSSPGREGDGSESCDSIYPPGERRPAYLRRAQEGRARRSQTPLTSEWEQESPGPEDVMEDAVTDGGLYHETSRFIYRTYCKLRDDPEFFERVDDRTPDPPQGAKLKAMARAANSKAKLAEIIAKVVASREKMPPGEPSAKVLGTVIQDDLAILLEATKRFGRPKGYFFKAIQTATASLLNATNDLVARATRTEELAERVETMRAELDQLRADMESRPPQVSQTPQEEPPLTMRAIGAMVDAKIAGIADRLLPEKRLRPPLEADRSAARGRAMASKIKERRDEVDGPPRKGKRRKRKRRTAAVPPVVELPAVPAPATTRVAEAGRPGTSWAVVAARKAPPKKKKLDEPRSRPSPPSPRKAKKGRGAKCRRRRDRARTEAVTITLPEGSQVTYAEALTAAKGAVKLEELGIAPEEMRPRRTRTGGMLYELSGSDCGAKADKLAESLGASLRAMGARVLRPVRTREIKVLDLDDSTEAADVAKAVASAGGCAAEAVRVGSIHRAPRYLGVANVRCPLVAAQRLLSTGRLVVGWSRARVVALEARAEFCFCCLECGHVGAQCPNRKSAGRGARCYKCSEPGHTARECRAPERRCPLCVDMGLPHAHRLGSRQCAQAKGGGRTRRPPYRSGEAQGAVVTTTPMDTATGQVVDAGSVTRAAPAE